MIQIHVWQILLVSPVLVILIAEFFVSVYEFFYVFLILGIAALKDPGATALSARRTKEQLQEFKIKHKKEIKTLVGRKSYQYWSECEDAPEILKELTKIMLEDQIFVALLWVAFPAEWTMRKVKRMIIKEK